MKKRIRIRVRGDVQGVSMRYYVKEFSREKGIVGWVTNKKDGSVEIVAEADEEILFALLELCKKGPKWAHVVKVTEAWEDPTDSYDEFRIIY
tara:strand:+ start:13000 stop:13275 length:276 start_codon:yes stop_codon:yes gene_type:complete